MKSLSRVSTIGCAVLALAAVGITLVTFCSLIIPEYRKATFYQVVASTAVAELVFFGYLAYLLAAGQKGTDPAHAVRLRTMLLVALWGLAILISGAFAVVPRYADSLYSDRILIWQMLGTFLALAAAFFLNRQQAAIEEKMIEPERQRTQVQSYALGVDSLLAKLTPLAAKRPAKAVELEQLSKRLDTLRSELQGAFPRTERAAGRLVDPAPLELIEQNLRELHDQIQRLAQVSDAQLEGELDTARQRIDNTIAAVRHRQKSLSF
jgi:hypothetical protein